MDGLSRQEWLPLIAQKTSFGRTAPMKENGKRIFYLLTLYLGTIEKLRDNYLKLIAGLI